MARATLQTISALRRTASRLQTSPDYQWGHMGSCNCGFLAREVTRLSKEAIHSCALQRPGDWSDQLNDYCPSSGLPMDRVIEDLLSVGFTRDDLKHLERLSDRKVLRTLPPEDRHLTFNCKADTITYLHAWANLLEARLQKETESVLPKVGILAEV